MTPTEGVESFDVCGPLPQGTLVLEASAGTGKTTTIASLTARYIAEGLATMPELMLITFGRAATAELRSRVRERLVEVERALRSTAISDDPVVTMLGDVDDTERALRARRLRSALAQFDDATIVTTHGFCQRVRTLLGTVGDLDVDSRLEPDSSEVHQQVIDDFYVAKYAPVTTHDFPPAQMRAVATAALNDPVADLRPIGAPEPVATRVRMAQRARTEVARRRRQAQVIDYNDLLVQLRDALHHPDLGALAAERVRGAYRVVMVDEFQDTDPVQWDILRTAFAGARTLILIGDPKQAIYAFRGGDVTTYLAAVRSAPRQTLHRNWRTDEPVLAGLDQVLLGAALGHPQIAVRPVQAMRAAHQLTGAPPVVLRSLTREVSGGSPAKLPSIGEVRRVLYRDVADQVVQRLNTTTIRTTGDSHRPTRAGDIAIVVRRNADASGVLAALHAAGVPAVMSTSENVFETSAARDWVTLLSALTRTDPGLVATAALTPMLGWDASTLGNASDLQLDDLQDRFARWAAVLHGGGVAALMQALADDGLRERLLSRVDGERYLTDLRHVAEILHATARADRLAPTGLLRWLRGKVQGSGTGEESERRLETDSAAAQVMTVHAAKGLQFPLVMVPFLSDRYIDGKVQIHRYHDGDQRCLHIGGRGSPGYGDAAAAALEEEAGELLRLAYVALTRARSHVTLWWSPSTSSASGPLSRLLLAGRQPDGSLEAKVPTHADPTVKSRFDALAAASGGTLVHQVVTQVPDQTTWAPPEVPQPALTTATLTRRPDTAWRRTSYTGLTAQTATPHAGLSGEPEQAGMTDEPDDQHATTAPVPPDAHSPASPMADLPSGTAFGTLVHSVLETIDTDAPDLLAELTARCEQTGLTPALRIEPAALARSLVPALTTPLGPIAENLALLDVPPADRLAELEFELPLAGGDTPDPDTAAATLAKIADLLDEHLASDDPFADYGTHLRTHLTPHAVHAPLVGYLTGSIDAVLRVRDHTGTPRYLVVDYKTNRLALRDEPLTLAHYQPGALIAAMYEHHYPLQLLLYAVALHRYLRWRQRGYDPCTHLAGGAYLFVRGMPGPDATTHPATGHALPAPSGVVAWRPPTELVLALSDLLAGVSS
ncbi:exodeoxyribonuclease V [Cellulomonas hominis]|uniref:RecBCD enzyme subunit RecB n=1 Tax=Cellulomonas hominis TaxID=156981 RepID=A0A7Z8NSX5_9CELL|nr:UvrD-helicase domain-containing protein [Cellulomonas hominis]TKR27002.1 exodeoxyribonuclease V [Cellulomonas hominis]